MPALSANAKWEIALGIAFGVLSLLLLSLRLLKSRLQAHCDKIAERIAEEQCLSSMQSQQNVKSKAPESAIQAPGSSLVSNIVTPQSTRVSRSLFYNFIKPQPIFGTSNL